MVDYTYDNLDRLTQQTPSPASGGGPGWGYTYDANGNRLTENTHSYTYTSASNRLTQGPAGTITTDATGNITQHGPWTYSYNNMGQLATIHHAGTQIATYTYNHQRQRTRKVTAQGTVLYHYDIQGNLLQETTEAGQVLNTYLWADTQPIAQLHVPQAYGKVKKDKDKQDKEKDKDKKPKKDKDKDTNTGPNTGTPGVERIIYLHTDHLNTPRLATDTTQTVIWRWEGQAFGVTLPNEDVDSDGIGTIINLRYAGQYFDSESGLHYNWNRYYDPKLGRYITSDPIGVEGGLNTYSYALQNPVIYYDPIGLNVGQGVIHGGRTGGQIGGAIGGPPGAIVGGVIGGVIGGLAGLLLSEIIGDGIAGIDDRTIPKPEKPSCGCTCNCRADANDNIPGNVKPGENTFVIASATADNCAAATKEAKRAAIQALGKQPKHVGCRCAGK